MLQVQGGWGAELFQREQVELGPVEEAMVLMRRVLLREGVAQSLLGYLDARG